MLPDGSIKFIRSVGQPLVSSSGELEFIGQVMAAITRQLGAVSSNLRVLEADLEDDKSLAVVVCQDLLRIAQEAISNALRHAKSTAISVNLRSDPPNLILKVKDNGIGITTEAETREGFGFANMRARVKKLKRSCRNYKSEAVLQLISNCYQRATKGRLVQGIL